MLVGGREVGLTAREFEIVLRMAEHPGWVFSADQLADEPTEGEFSPESVTVHVSRLRRKLAEAGAPDVVQTMRGFGYRLRSEGHQRTDADQGDGHRDRTLRDAWWRLEQAVLEFDEAAKDEQHEFAVAALEDARRTLNSILAG